MKQNKGSLPKKLSMKEYYPKKEGWSLYIKPTRRVHESGYRIFEVGYCSTDDKEIREKLGECSDIVHTDFRQLYENIKIPMNMDCTKNGLIRIWGSEKHELVWRKNIMSSAEITVLSN